MGAEATNLDKYRYHEVFMASGDDIDGPSPWKCGGSMWKFVEVFFFWKHNLSRPVLETYPSIIREHPLAPSMSHCVAEAY